MFSVAYRSVVFAEFAEEALPGWASHPFTFEDVSHDVIMTWFTYMSFQDGDVIGAEISAEAAWEKSFGWKVIVRYLQIKEELERRRRGS